MQDGKKMCDKMCVNFVSFLKIKSYKKTTKLDKNAMEILKFRLEYGKRSSRYIAAKWCNKMPKQISKITTANNILNVNSFMLISMNK